MKKYLLSMLIAMFAVVSFAQPLAMKQKGVKQLKSIAGVQVVKPERTFKLSPVVKGLKAPAARHSFGKSNTKAQRRAQGEFTVEDLAGEYIDAQQLYDVDPETYELIPSVPSRMARNVSIEAGDGNQIKIYLWDNEHPITGTVDLENFTISIPANQILGNDETYGDITMRNAQSETDFTGKIYANGIMIDQLWFGSVVYQGSDANYTGVIGSFLAFPNGTMTFINSQSQEVVANVAIMQNEETHTASVYNFGDFGFCVDISLLSDHSFFINSDQIVYSTSTAGDFNPWGFDGQYLVEFTGKATTATTLVSDNDWIIYSQKGYGINGKAFTIELLDGEFSFPEPLPVVTLPDGLTPEAKTSYYTTGSSSNRQKHTGTVNVAKDGTDVYIQGLDLDIPAAWVKGTYDETTGLVTIPVTYMGKASDTPHYFGGYGENGKAVPFVLEYSPTTDSYYGPNWVEFFKTEMSTEVYYYSGLFIGTKPTAATMPADVTPIELPYTGKYLDQQTGELKDFSGNVKIGTKESLVFIQGLYDTFAFFENNCLVGQVMENEGSKFLVIPSGEYVGEFSSGFLGFALSYTYDAETEQIGFSNIIFSYDDTANYLVLQTPLALSRSSLDVNYSQNMIATLTIGTDPSGIEAVKIVKAAGDGAWYTIGGQRVAQPTQKGLYIHNGKKFVIK